MNTLRLTSAALAPLLLAACFHAGGMDEFPASSDSGSASATGGATEGASVTSSPGPTGAPSTDSQTAGSDPTPGTDPTTITDGTSTCATACGETTASSDPTTWTTGETTVECMGDCVPRRVFVSLGAWPGDFANMGNAFDVADAKCAEDAMSAMPPGTFKAWLGSGTDGPKTRFDVNFMGPYMLVGGVEPIAWGFADLLDGMLDGTINADVNGEIVDVGPEVWTGVEADGEVGLTCENWTSQGAMGTFGNFEEGNWTAFGEGACDTPRRLYCFEVPA